MTNSSLIIADLHLSPERPDITSCFCQFLVDSKNKHDSLYILGDLFEAWIGDDDISLLQIPLPTSLQNLQNQPQSTLSMVIETFYLENDLQKSKNDIIAATTSYHRLRL
ncbi:hypothetical protein [Psychrosphaera algicola]|uniref:hypothetical protein n=1 Tax=Psychrosphaera algicola TaxID=3023714 RepID=UPI002FEE12E8